MSVITRTAASSASTPRWHAHGWNNRLSWELVLRITPHLPGFVVMGLRAALSSLCVACMPRERAAVRRNLQRVLGLPRPAGLGYAWRTFFEFIHMGHWDLGLKMLARGDVPVHVVMMRRETEQVARYAQEARSEPGMIVHEAGSSSLLAVELMAALRRGEIVTVQMDRVVGDQGIPTPFFGTEAPLPTGPVRLAMATGAPLLPVFVLLQGRDRFRLMTLPPLRFEDSLQDGMRRMAGAMEQVVAQHPTQWFNFFDVWPAAS
jgi:lauroyl/myristoyl acyltransferase